MSRRVVVTGAGLVSALGDTPAALHAALCAGRRGFGPVRQFDLDGERPCAAEIEPFQAEQYLGGRSLRPLDRAAQLLAAAGTRALADAGWSPDALGRAEVGLVTGTVFCSARTIAEFDRRALRNGPCYASPMDFANTVINAAAGQTAIWLGLRGVNSTVSTGSSAGLSAIAHATDLIRSGRAVAVLAGGVEELCFETFYAFLRAGLLCGSPDGGWPDPRPFDARRQGFALGEGAALLVLEDGEWAAARGARVCGEIRGHAAWCADPEGDDSQRVRAVARAVRLALDDAALRPEDIDGVSASANGSRLWDHCESLALRAVFGDRTADLPVTAIKGMTGEALGAGGALQAAAALETLRTGELSGIPGLTEQEPSSPLRGAGSRTRGVGRRNCLVNSVSFDGHCCAVVLGRAETEVAA